MALPVLDGNQSATTLSSVVTGGEHIVAHTVVSLGSQAISDITSAFPATQTIAGTVTANVGKVGYDGGNDTNYFPIAFVDSPGGGLIQVSQDSNGGLPISGTVTANVDFASEQYLTPNRATQIGFKNTAPDFVFVEEGTNNFPVKIFTSDGAVGGGNASLPIAGTVTIAALPSGSLTTRFGSVTTANTAQITSAVTNTSRKYLLAQNISAGTVTIGIGFSPTTTQGIQLTAGGGLTFDAFCPTGAVYWLGAVTGAAFTILEG